MGNGALPHGPSDRAHPRLYLRISSLRRTNSVAIGGRADILRADWFGAIEDRDELGSNILHLGARR